MNTLMTHIVAGYPTLKESEKIAEVMLETGVSYLEIQIPFSDPVADGPTIMRANQVALENGTTPEDCFKMMERLKKKSKTPILFMTYYNIAFHYGVERFCIRAKSIGCYGLIIPDMPVDEESYDHYLKMCKKHKLHAIQIISPITPDTRLKKIGKVASGFVYCVSRTGTTGESRDLNKNLETYLKRVRKYIRVPIALGFGISNVEHVHTALRSADIAVIGSAVINLLTNKRRRSMEYIRKFLSNIIYG